MSSEKIENTLEIKTPDQKQLPEVSQEVLQEEYNKLLRRKALSVYTNSHLQHKLSEHFRRKKSTESQSTIKNNQDQGDEDGDTAGEAIKETTHEQRYARFMSNLKQNRVELENVKTENEKVISDTRATKETMEATERQSWDNLVDLYRNIASQAVSSRTGKHITQADIESYIKNLEKKEEEVSQQRLENIKMTNKLKKKELQLKQREELADGLHLIDFEQLKIENQTYNEKIEERNEELMKLHQKITNTVQVLTHYKEKLQFMELDSNIQSEKLVEVEQDVIKRRDMLTKQKQKRDKLRADIHTRQQNAGLLGSIGSGNTGQKKSFVLLEDFENRLDEINKLEADIDSFKTRHEELTLDIKVLEKKLEKSNEAGAAVPASN